MSYLMDYGDRPPAPEAVAGQKAGPVFHRSSLPEHEHEPLTLWQKCGVTVVAYAVLWATAALVLHALVPSDVTLVFH